MKMIKELVRVSAVIMSIGVAYAQPHMNVDKVRYIQLDWSQQAKSEWCLDGGAFLRVYTSGQRGPIEFIVPGGTGLVITDIEWTGHPIEGVTKGAVMNLRLSAFTAGAGSNPPRWQVFESGPKIVPDSQFGRNAVGGEHYLTEGFLIDEGKKLCAFLTSPGEYGLRVRLRGYMTDKPDRLKALPIEDDKRRSLQPPVDDKDRGAN